MPLVITKFPRDVRGVARMHLGTAFGMWRFLSDDSHEQGRDARPVNGSVACNNCRAFAMLSVCIFLFVIHA